MTGKQGFPGRLAALSVLLGAPFLCAAEEAAPFRYQGDLRIVEQVQLSLPGAVIRLDGEGRGRGRLAIARVRGPETCKAVALAYHGILYIAEESALRRIFPVSLFEGAVPDEDAAGTALPELPREIPRSKDSGECSYSVDLETPEATDASLQVFDGTDIEIENWEEPLHVRAGTGTVAFSKIGDLDLECESCDLSGEGIGGSLRYQIGVGTVGVTQLSGAVDGVSKGDVKLNWRRVKAHTEIRIVSEAGDVTLNIPKSHSLALSLAAPRGDVYTKGSSYSRGIPVHVEAKAGTIRMIGR